MSDSVMLHKKLPFRCSARRNGSFAATFYVCSLLKVAIHRTLRRDAAHFYAHARIATRFGTPRSGCRCTHHAILFIGLLVTLTLFTYRKGLRLAHHLVPATSAQTVPQFTRYLPVNVPDQVTANHNYQTTVNQYLTCRMYSNPSPR